MRPSESSALFIQEPWFHMFLENYDHYRAWRAGEPEAEPYIKGLSNLSTQVIKCMAKCNLVSAGSQRDVDLRWAWTPCWERGLHHPETEVGQFRRVGPCHGQVCKAEITPIGSKDGVKWVMSSDKNPGENNEHCSWDTCDMLWNAQVIQSKRMTYRSQLKSEHCSVTWGTPTSFQKCPIKI